MGGNQLSVVERQGNGQYTTETLHSFVEGSSSHVLQPLVRTRGYAVWQTLKTAFLPEGFPESVTPDYLPFQFWDTVQGLSTYIRSMLSTQVLLAALGVGEQSATAIGATFLWFVRDFTGMLGGILFAFFKGSNLDSNAKQWRLAADIINDVGMLLDLVSPLLPGAFLPMLCLGSVSRAITGTASGATRAALTQHFALRQNAADISAKEGSQETAATMVGMLLGMLVAQITARHVAALWATFLSLTVLHVYANYQAMQSLCLTSLNRDRVAILVNYYMAHGSVMTPQEAAPRERILPLPPHTSISLTSKQQQRKVVVLGAKISSLKIPGGWEQIKKIKALYSKASYMLIIEEGRVHALLSKHANVSQQLQAFIHSLVLSSYLCCTPAVGQTFSGDDKESIAQEWMIKHYDVLIDSMRLHGWDTHRVLLSPGDSRVDWDNNISKHE